MSEAEVLINQYSDGNINFDELKINIDKYLNIKTSADLLEFSLNKLTKNGVNLFNAVWQISILKLDQESIDCLVKKYLSIIEGHYEHEDMIEYFHRTFIEPNINVHILTSLIKNPPAYFRDADRENVFLEKCLFTISKQPTSKSKNALKEFSQSENETVAAASKVYLEKISMKDQ